MTGAAPPTPHSRTARKRRSVWPMVLRSVLKKALTTHMKQRLHIIPLGHPEPLHTASLDCWCHPRPKERGEMAIHNAKDGREKWERQGIIDQDKPWCLVYEDVPSGDLRVPLFSQNK